MKLFQVLTNEIDRVNLGQVNANSTLEELIDNFLPKGSGFDSQIFIDFGDEKFCKKYTLKVPYHCMNDNGYYDGWIEVDYTITPSFSDYDVKENWKGYNGKYKEVLRDYMVDTLIYHLDQEVESVWNMEEKRNYYKKVIQD